ncbi:hypothetical protein AB6A40_000866 [Gnathostoma spinigerum]|uniref:Pyrrolo-quinoline quinone repeat domain-containing protein n=1 Tax=Gnathostoma spinigerum TaxID=75299 RepID=A0ABD6E514_9BILA
MFFSFISFLFCCQTLLASMEIHSSYPSEASGMVFVSSIDGYLRSIDPKTGIDQWVFKEEPVLRAPLTIQHGFTFIPDPKDGSLYLLRDGNLKKLPYSIPQLVASSPCRTTDGVMYAGSKRDVWLGLNPETGIKVEELSETAVPQKCPVNKENTIFIGRSEYHLSMFDLSNRSRKWNATFNDYSSHLLPADVSYPYQHFASSSDGQILTVDASTGAILWQRDIGSTIVAIYLLQNDGLHKLPYTVIGRETLEELIKMTVKCRDTRVFPLEYDEETAYYEETVYVLREEAFVTTFLIVSEYFSWLTDHLFSSKLLANMI